MTHQFASIELARLYESQGYLEDALAMYRTLDDEGGQEEGPEIRAAITRLEASMANRDKPAAGTGELNFEKMIAEVNAPASGDERDPGQGVDRELASNMAFPEDEGLETGPEERLSRLLEKWVMLMVAQRRVRAFKAVRGKV